LRSQAPAARPAFESDRLIETRRDFTDAFPAPAWNSSGNASAKPGQFRLQCDVGAMAEQRRGRVATTDATIDATIHCRRPNCSRQRVHRDFEPDPRVGSFGIADVLHLRPLPCYHPTILGMRKCRGTPQRRLPSKI